MYRISAISLFCLLLFSAGPGFSQAPLSQVPENYENLIFEAFPLNQPATEQAETVERTLLAATPAINATSTPTINRINQLNQQLSSVQSLENTEGPYSFLLAEPLDGLASLYYELGNYEQAITTLERAQHIKRVNLGLFTLEQVPLVESLITNYEALNNFNKVDQMQAYLFYVHQRNYSNSDTEMTDASLNWAKWNIEAYLKNPEEINVDSLISDRFSPFSDRMELVYVRDPITHEYYKVPKSSISNFGSFSRSDSVTSNLNSQLLNMRQIIDPHLREAQLLYQSLLEFPVEELSVTRSEPQRQQIQRQLANASFQINKQVASVLRQLRMSANTHMSFIKKDYSASKNAFEQIVNTITNDNQATPEQLAQAQLDLADWHLSYGLRQAAYRLYQDIYEKLIEENYSIEQAKAIISPQVSIPVPAFATHLFSRKLWNIADNIDIEYKGYIDVNFTYDRGNARRPRILASSTGTPQIIQTRLLDKLTNEVLRPSVIDGHIAEQTNLNLRYYYTY